MDADAELRVEILGLTRRRLGGGKTILSMKEKGHPPSRPINLQMKREIK
jgi:hypothetical protein